MASSSATAPSPDSPSSPAAPPPPSPSNSSSSSSPPPSSSPSPPAPPSPTPKSSPSPSDSPPPKSSPPSPPSDASPPPPPKSATVASPPPPPHSSGAFSPPPPPQQKSSPASTTPNSSSPSRSSPSSSNNLQVTVGVAVGVGLLIIVMVVIMAMCTKKKKKKKRDNMQYYGDSGYRPQGGEYYNSNPQQPNWHNNGYQPPVSAGSPGGGGPPWPMPSSGEMSSNFSGPHQAPLPPPSPSIAFGFNNSTFTYDELAAATGGFAQENLLGQGGFGYVHKGVLPNGKEIAVKSLKTGSGQGEREFMAEVEIISRVHHRHLVSLEGYCIVGAQRLLVYEFVPNKTLEYHLHGKGLPTMDWPTRLRIATGAAKGLAYLHEDCHPRIIHRDIKSANILLDFNFEAMVADFGLAKLSSDNYTHVSTRVMGTFGYLAPEYASSGKLTEKSDIFSFGVMLLELITGKRAVDPTNTMDDSLVDWARPLLSKALENGTYEGLVDFRLENNYNPPEMVRMVACAAASIRHSARKRPRMSQIVRALEGVVALEDLNEGMRPNQNSIFSSNSSSDYDANAYTVDVKNFKKTGLSSQDSGEHGTSSNDSREIVNSENQK